MIDRAMQQAALDVISRSAIARGAARLSRRLESFGRQSRSLRQASLTAGAWRRLDNAQRRRVIGIALVTAATMHVALTVLNRVPAGWMWLIVPAIATAQGVVLAVAGRRPTDPS